MSCSLDVDCYLFSQPLGQSLPSPHLWLLSQLQIHQMALYSDRLLIEQVPQSAFRYHPPEGLIYVKSTVLCFFFFF